MGATDASVGDADTQSPGPIWTFGSGLQYASLVQSRAETLYVAVVTSTAPPSSLVIAVAPTDGHELWRLVLNDVVQSLICNGAGDVWARGTSVGRISAAGALLWQTRLGALPATAGTQGSLGPDGTSYFFAPTGGMQLRLQAIGSGGALSWSLPVGGNTSTAMGAQVTFMPAPPIGPSGLLYVPCSPCGNGQGGVEIVDATGAVVGTSPSVEAIDTNGNLYGRTGATGPAVRVWSSSDALGAPRWQSTVPATNGLLLGAAGVNVQATAGQMMLLASKDGTIGSTSSWSYPGVLEALIAGGSYYISSGGPGASIVDSGGHVVWADSNMLFAVPGQGRVYGVEQQSAAGPVAKPTQRLVAVSAPIQGLDQGPWPIGGHDPGGTHSAAGTW